VQKNTFPDIRHEISLFDEKSVSGFHSEIAGRYTVVDMGCGHGDFLIEKTASNPDPLFIGIEISRKRAFKTSERLSKRNIENFRVVDSDGELALKLLFPEGSIDEIHINFPDPWLRIRQWKNRIFKPSFLIQSIRILKKGGTINFVTDVREYAEQAGKLLMDFPRIKNNYKNLVEPNICENFPTLFYRKMSPLRDINYISFKKI
jgi:tRNA (guanine-N7-)-methyltransferase